MRRWFAIPLWQRVVGALILGVVLALAVPAGALYVQFIGDLFVRAIRMLVAPLVLVTLAAGLPSLADPTTLGSLGGRTIGLFALTTAIAVSIGMLVASLLQPGGGAPLGTAAPHALGTPVTPYDQQIGIIPLNIVDALAKGDMLALIFVAILFGVGTVLTGDAGKPFAGLLQSLSAVLLRVILRFVAKLPGLPVFKGIVDALVGAFSTASSGATLPFAMRVAEENLGVSRPVYSTVLPLGASIGKDGTAMYVGLLSMFALQAFGTPLTPSVYALVLLTGSLAAFGTAPVPSASLFMLAAVLSAVGIAPEQTALVVGFVLPFDRLLDMTRTVPSACANLTVATTVARWEGELDEAVYRSTRDA